VVLAYLNISVTVISAESIDNAVYEESINAIQYSGEDISQLTVGKKGIILDFYGDWCRPCKYMDAFILTDPELSKYINDNFTFVKINVDDSMSMKLKKKFKVKIYPTGPSSLRIRVRCFS
jgi:thiol-disulfide isomerase/thioredoxin